MFPVASIKPFEATSRDVPFSHRRPGDDYIYSQQWDFYLARKVHVNNQGFDAPYDYNYKTPSVIVVGDSYIEAAMVPPEEALQGYLQQRIAPTWQAVSLGLNSLSLADYLVRIAWAVKKFPVRHVIVLVSEDDPDESVVPASGGRAYFQCGDDACKVMTSVYVPRMFGGMYLADLLDKSYLTRYFVTNLRVAETLRRIGVIVPRSVNREVSDPRIRQRVFKAFLQELNSILGNAHTGVTLLLDHDRKSIYVPSRPNQNQNSIHMMVKEASEYGFCAHDLWPKQAAYYALQKKKVDFSPVDGHWNAAGHKLAADLVAKDLESNCSSNRRDSTAP